MNTKSTMKKLLLIIILIIMIFSTNKCYAGVFDAIWGTIKGGWGYWLTDNSTMMDINMDVGLTSTIHESDDITKKALGVFQLIGSILSVVALIIIGIRYMASSLEEKAQLKGVLIYYIIGCVLIFATSNILSIVYNVITGLE